MSDRDQYRPKDPPPHVQQQIAESPRWPEDDTGRHNLESVSQHVKDATYNGALAVDRIDGVRLELKEDIRLLGDKVSALGTATAEVSGKLEYLIQDRQQTSAAKVTMMTTEVEIAKTRALSQIDETKKSNEFRRSIMIRIVAGIGVVWTAVSAYLLAK